MLRIKRLTNLKNLQRCQRTRWSVQFNERERSLKIQRELQRRTQARCIRRCIASEMRRLSRQNRIRSSSACWILQVVNVIVSSPPFLSGKRSRLSSWRIQRIFNQFLWFTDRTEPQSQQSPRGSLGFTTSLLKVNHLCKICLILFKNCLYKEQQISWIFFCLFCLYSTLIKNINEQE